MLLYSVVVPSKGDPTLKPPHGSCRAKPTHQNDGWGVTLRALGELHAKQRPSYVCLSRQFTQEATS